MNIFFMVIFFANAKLRQPKSFFERKRSSKNQIPKLRMVEELLRLTTISGKRATNFTGQLSNSCTFTT